MSRRPSPRRGGPARLADLGGAVMLGVATLFVPKARPDDHWSTSPKVEIAEESASASDSAPPARRRRRLRA